MKKLFIIITLLMSSFFFFSLEKVSAITYISNDITPEVMSWINEDFYAFRDKVIEHCEENNLYYIIVRSISDSTYKAYVSNRTSRFSFGIQSASNIIIKLIVGGTDVYNFTNNDMKYYTTLPSSSELNMYHYDTGHELYILDSNFDFIYNVSVQVAIRYWYNSSVYPVVSGHVFPTLYKIYLDANPIPPDPYEEERVVMNNFYSTIFTKISDLATSISTNFTFLVIFAIFILIFVFELVRRKFL